MGIYNLLYSIWVPGLVELVLGSSGTVSKTTISFARTTLVWIIHENAQFSLAPGMPYHYAHRKFCSVGNTVGIPLPLKIPCEHSGRRDNRTFHE